MRMLHAGLGLALLIAGPGCGGGSGGGSTAAPTGPSAGGPSTVTIVGERGARSFDPNPSPSGPNQMIVWRNSDAVVHRIVTNDGTLDTGDIPPGATSRALQLPAAGTNYHCSIHPTMVGAINAVAGPPPPCTGPYCDEG